MNVEHLRQRFPDEQIRSSAFTWTSMISKVKGEAEISLLLADILRGVTCCTLRAV